MGLDVTKSGGSYQIKYNDKAGNTPISVDLPDLLQKIALKHRMPALTPAAQKNLNALIAKLDQKDSALNPKPKEGQSLLDRFVDLMENRGTGDRAALSDLRNLLSGLFKIVRKTDFDVNKAVIAVKLLIDDKNLDRSSAAQINPVETSTSPSSAWQAFIKKYQEPTPVSTFTISDFIGGTPIKSEDLVSIRANQSNDKAIKALKDIISALDEVITDDAEKLNTLNNLKSKGLITLELLRGEAIKYSDIQKGLGVKDAALKEYFCDDLTLYTYEISGFIRNLTTIKRNYELLHQKAVSYSELVSICLNADQFAREADLGQSIQKQNSGVQITDRKAIEEIGKIVDQVFTADTTGSRKDFNGAVKQESEFLRQASSAIGGKIAGKDINIIEPKGADVLFRFPDNAGNITTLQIPKARYDRFLTFWFQNTSSKTKEKFKADLIQWLKLYFNAQERGLLDYKGLSVGMERKEAVRKAAEEPKSPTKYELTAIVENLKKQDKTLKFKKYLLSGSSSFRAYTDKITDQVEAGQTICFRMENDGWLFVQVDTKGSIKTLKREQAVRFSKTTINEGDSFSELWKDETRPFVTPFVQISLDGGATWEAWKDVQNNKTEKGKTITIRYGDDTTNFSENVTVNVSLTRSVSAGSGDINALLKALKDDSAFKDILDKEGFELVELPDKISIQKSGREIGYLQQHKDWSSSWNFYFTPESEVLNNSIQKISGFSIIPLPQKSLI